MKPVGVTIRPFQEADEDAVVALWSSAFSGDPPWNEPREVIQRKLLIQRDLFLVGERRGQVVATVLGGYDGFRGWVYHLAVAENERRQGIGQAMMGELEKRLRALGCPKVNLQVRASNTDVVLFYQSLDYRVEERVSMGKRLT